MTNLYDPTFNLYLQEVTSQIQKWLLNAEVTTEGVYFPLNGIDLPADGVGAGQGLDPPPGRIRLRFNGSGLELVDENGTVLGVTSFLGLQDTPANYAGSGNYSVEVNFSEDGLVFVPKSSTALVENEWVMGGPLHYTSEIQLRKTAFTSLASTYRPARRCRSPGAT